MQENEDEQPQLDALETLLAKYHSGKLTMQDLKEFNIKLSAGAIRCSGIAENKAEIETLKQSASDIQLL